MTKNNTLKQESGIVSIMVTLIMMIVISLIIIGFAQVTRSNQREALDRQLSTQAYYAAETGVNDIYTAVQTTAGATAFSLHNFSLNDSCDTVTTALSLSDGGKLNSDGSVGYTCLRASDKIPNIIKTVGVGDTEVVPVNPEVNGIATAPNTLTFTWQTANPVIKGASGCNPSSFTKTDSWKSLCPFGILRVDIFDASAAGADAETTLTHDKAVFFRPAVTGSTFPFSTPTSASVANASCTFTTCTGTISGLSGTNYFVRLVGIYEEPKQVTIAPGPTAPPNVTFSGAQIIVDSTGKAQDVLRRIQVRLSIVPPNSIPPLTNALASGTTICKRFTTLGSGHNASDGGDTPAEFPNELCPNP